MVFINPAPPAVVAPADIPTTFCDFAEIEDGPEIVRVVLYINGHDGTEQLAVVPVHRITMPRCGFANSLIRAHSRFPLSMPQRRGLH